MKLSMSIKMACAGLALASILPACSQAQAQRAITLDPPTGWELQSQTMNSKGEMLPQAPDNFRRLGEAHVGQLADLHTLTLRFNQTTKITGIAVTKDFRLEQGGSCVEGNVYNRGTTCRLLVRFTPQGPGNRLGKLTVAGSSSATPLDFGLGGTSFMPVVSFIPSIITTVPGTYPSSIGLLSGAQNLSEDGSDNLYIADTGNNEIRTMDSSGIVKTILSSVTAPWGVAADPYGDIWFTERSSNGIYEVVDGYGVKATGTGTGTCTDSTPCILKNEAVIYPGSISINANGAMIFSETSSFGAGVSQIQPSPATYFEIYDPFNDQYANNRVLAEDANGNIYTASTYGGNGCEIRVQTLSNAEISAVDYTKVAGGLFCGFSGDGGLAGSAEISKYIGQITFDTGGNMYFTDEGNGRVRRIDASTGYIRTIAGNGTFAYNGDGGAATSAAINSPTGVAVDSQGQVYIISTGATSGQVLRKVGATGYLNLGSQLKGTKSKPSIITVTNTGNAALLFTNVVFTGANPADFSMDPGTTSCFLVAANYLDQGSTCQIGFVFTPSTGGTRTANLVLLDNTGTNSNTVQLSGFGTLAANLAITSPASGASFVSGTSISFTGNVTYPGQTPTGTVQLSVDSINYGSALTLVNGSASTKITGLSTAGHKLCFTYSGDSYFVAGGPVCLNITVTAAVATPIVTLVPAMNTATSCKPASFEAVVSNQLGIVPTGRVHLLDGSRELAAAQLSDGHAALTPLALSPGSYSLTVHYDGDAHDHAAVSAVLHRAVLQSNGCSTFAQDPALPLQGGAQPPHD